MMATCVWQVGGAKHTLSYWVEGFFCYPPTSQSHPPIRDHRTPETYTLIGNTCHYQ